jgi:pyrroline-5-carboxylate reductase
VDNLSAEGLTAQQHSEGNMIIGILGVGHLGSILAEALHRRGAGGLLLAPRGKAAEIAARHGLSLARDNAHLVAAADVVILAVRPRDAVAALGGLPWRPGQRLVSACAGISAGDLAAALPEGVLVRRIMPLTAAAQGASPTTLFPADPGLDDLLAAFGPVIPMRSEAEFETATVCAAVYGWMQKLVQVTAEWSEAQGLPPETARQLAALTTVAAGRNAADSPLSMPRLLAELVTPGGITECGLAVLGERQVFPAWQAACQAVLARLVAR